MSQENEKAIDSEIDSDAMLPESDFSNGVRGKYYEAFMQSSNVVILDPDVAEIFRDFASVDAALRLLAKIAKSVPS